MERLTKELGLWLSLGTSKLSLKQVHVWNVVMSVNSIDMADLVAKQTLISLHAVGKNRSVEGTAIPALKSVTISFLAKSGQLARAMCKLALIAMNSASVFHKPVFAENSTFALVCTFHKGILIWFTVIVGQIVGWHSPLSRGQLARWTVRE